MRLIDADELRSRLIKYLEEDCFMTDVLVVVDTFPTIEAEPVVRCRDCRKRRSRECPMCDYEQLWDDDEGWIDAYRDRTEDEGFCHKGAMMDGGSK